MMIALEKPFASNKPASPKDVRVLKIALNRLGYYQPPKQIGISDTPDRELVSALKAFQREQGLRVSGEIRPHDATQDALKQAEGEKARLEAQLENLLKLKNKEKSVIKGDKGIARDIGAGVGMIAGGIIADLPGAAAGIGAGSSLGPIIEEGLDFLTGKKTDVEIDVEIKSLKDRIKPITTRIQAVLQPMLQNAIRLEENAQAVYLGCIREHSG